MKPVPLDLAKGTIHTSERWGTLLVTHYVNSVTVHAKFLATGYETVTTGSTIRAGQVKDRLVPSVYGIGYIGDGKHAAAVNGKVTPMYACWKCLIGRCYDPLTMNRNPTYNDCTVCSEWLNYQVFAEWYMDNFIDGYTLDKDKLVAGNRIYAPEFCCFIPREENTEISQAKAYKFKNPMGKLIEVFNLNKFCRGKVIDPSAMSRVSRGISSHHHQWTAA